MNSELLLQELKSAVEPDRVQTTGGYGTNVPAAWNILATVSPVSEAETVGVVRAVETAGAALLPCGGGTQIATGYPPASERLLVLFGTSQWNHILDYQPDDMTVTCEPGLTLAALQRLLAERRQRLALDVPLPEQATLGGIVSANTAGFWRAAYGAPRDLLIGMRAVMTEGEVVKGGGKVVKNVAGYDVCKLFTGAWGTLGVLTELTFRIRPMPETEQTLRWPVPDLATAVRGGQRMHQERLASAFLLATNELDGKPALLLGLHGTSSRVEWQAAEFTRLAAAAGLTTAPSLVSPAELDALRDRQARLDAPLALRVSCLPSELAELTSRLEAFPSVAITAQAMTGTLSLAVYDPAATTVSSLRAALPAGANIVWTRLNESIPDSSDIAIWGETRADFFLHRTLKQSLDPKNTFSPGRFLGKL